jgi:twitching motility two-component system response regulator PilH
MARLLLIDDDELATSVIKRALEHFGNHDVVVAHDGEAGLIAAHKESPDLILLDILMPKMNGYEVLKELKSTPDTLHIPVIIMSAVNNEKSIKETLYEYNALYMPKPVEPDTLIKTIDHALSCKE